MRTGAAECSMGNMKIELSRTLYLASQVGIYFLLSSLRSLVSLKKRSLANFLTQGNEQGY